ncbi:proteasome assembly chaperone 3-like [Ornithodoros turicata]|uniref:proteasome assembly chaperone 3-like n=1 Tax=Ornithodoros turicata TaxID=34597 RepID=UPI003138BBE9
MLADDNPATNLSADDAAASIFQRQSPLKTKVTAVQVGDQVTDIAISDFSDKLFVVVSQYQKLGTLVLITKDVALNGDAQEPVYDTKTLFGKDEPEIHAVARLFADALRCDKTILLGIALKDFSTNTVRTLASFLSDAVLGLS